ncbi:hypothetical protein TNCV_2017041 [Trichonephila clavipes]|nr:hypothetical protein TNCV_2017041 [Trichonephila clavipes]
MSCCCCYCCRVFLVGIKGKLSEGLRQVGLLDVWLVVGRSLKHHTAYTNLVHTENDAVYAGSETVYLGNVFYGVVGLIPSATLFLGLE